MHLSNRHYKKRLPLEYNFKTQPLNCLTTIIDIQIFLVLKIADHHLQFKILSKTMHVGI